MAKETTTAAGMNVAETETSHSKTIEITMAALFIALTVAVLLTARAMKSIETDL